ncbi:MAG TPA: 2-dehydropantoate 2-reductase [Methanocella sp.]|jgi:2-dehydropantoate 2-reductase
MNICIYGTGGVGGYFGGRMADAGRCHESKLADVFFIARGAHLTEIRRSGLILNTTERKNVVCLPAMATDDITAIPSPDLCLVCVKSYDLENALRDLKKVVRKDTIVIPLLNGVDIYERIRDVFAGGIVLPACVYVETHLEKPGTVTQKGGDGIIRLGPDPLYPEYYPSEMLKVLGELGIKILWNPYPFPEIWEKYVFIAGYGLVTTSYGCTIGEAYSDPALKELVSGVMAEITAIARRKDVRLPDDIVERSVKKAGNFTFGAKTSYQRDVEAKGRPNEGDLFGETIVKMGKYYGVPTPVTEQIYREIVKNKE